jgi:hypothetical protein
VKSCLFLFMALFVSGCATKHEKLETYVGEDIQEVVAVYGYPNVAFDMEEDRRDFQWVITSSTQPSYPISSGALTDPAKLFVPDIKEKTITPMFNGAVVTTECLYTMVTHWDEDAKSWIVTGYQQLTSGC